MPDDPTLGEVVRRFEDRLTDVRDDIAQLGLLLEKKVDERYYGLRHDALMQRVAALETLREKDAERIVATRRWLIGAVVVPLISVLMPVVILLVRGSGS